MIEGIAICPYLTPCIRNLSDWIFITFDVLKGNVHVPRYQVKCLCNRILPIIVVVGTIYPTTIPSVIIFDCTIYHRKSVTEISIRFEMQIIQTQRHCYLTSKCKHVIHIRIFILVGFQFFRQKEIARWS